MAYLDADCLGTTCLPLVMSRSKVLLLELALDMEDYAADDVEVSLLR